MSILSWFENNQESDIPPEYLWEDADGLEEWWNTVRRRRDEEMGARSSGDYIPDDDEMMGNDLTRAFKT